jgi:hypothetical protein
MQTSANRVVFAQGAAKTLTNLSLGMLLLAFLGTGLHLAEPPLWLAQVVSIGVPALAAAAMAYAYDKGSHDWCDATIAGLSVVTGLVFAFEAGAFSIHSKSLGDDAPSVMVISYDAYTGVAVTLVCAFVLLGLHKLAVAKRWYDLFD